MNTDGQPPAAKVSEFADTSHAVHQDACGRQCSVLVRSSREIATVDSF